MALDFVIPGDIVKSLGPNVRKRLHWAEQGRRTKSWKQRAHLYWLDAGGVQFSRKVRVTITLFRGRRVDPDNGLAAAKALMDGLKGPDRMIPDDGDHWIEYAPLKQEIGQQWKGREAVRLQIEEIE